MKYYRDADGRFLGGWDANPPAGAIEVPSAPDSARQVWNGTGWAALDARAVWRETAELSRIDLALALIGAQVLDASQAEDFAAGGIPAPLAGMVDALPVELRPEARIRLRGAIRFPRADAFWTALVAADAGWTDEGIDTVFGWREPG